MKLTFLGTSAGAPTATRNVTAQALHFDHGAVWLLDCGEATQHRLAASGVRAKAIERILLTHLHGDHCYGLPGMLACMGIHGREAPVQVVGPVGMRALVETVLRVSDLHPPFPLDLVELAPGERRPLPAWGAAAWEVVAIPIVHRLPCFGYRLREPPRPGRFHPERARAAGVPEGPLWGRLQRGGTVTIDDRAVTSEAVADPPRPGRTVLLLGDTCDADGMIADGAGCDLVVRETTYDEARAVQALRWQHSTTRMTGEFAAALGAKTLIITHLSARYTDPGCADDDERLGIADLVAETARHCPGTTVIAADDGWAYEF